MKGRLAIKHTSAIISGLVLIPSIFSCGPGINQSEGSEASTATTTPPPFNPRYS